MSKHKKILRQNKIRQAVKFLTNNKTKAKEYDNLVELCPKGCGAHKLSCLCDKFHEQRPNSRTWGKQD